MPIFPEDSFTLLKHPIIFGVPRWEFSSPWIEHVPFGFYITAAIKPSMFVELGTLHGVAYCAFCQAVAELNLPTKCFSVSTWANDQHTESYSTELNSLRQYHDPLYHEFSTLIQSTSDKAVERFEDGTIDLLHIDCYHTYEAVKHDFDIWKPKFSNSGMMILHGVNERMGNFGVQKLFEELKGKYPFFEFSHGHGLGVVALGSEISTELLPFFQSSENEANLVRNFFQSLGQRLALNKALNEQKQVERDLRNAIQARDEQLNNLEHEIKSIRVAKEQLQTSLTELQRSLVVRFLMRYREFLEEFLPQGSRQRRFYDSLLRRIRFSAKPNFSIIVFQPGDAGSKTIQESLVRTYNLLGLPVNVYYSQILSEFDKAVEIARKEGLDTKPRLMAIKAGRQLRKTMDRSGNHTWKIISIVQDPVDQHTETLFQVLDKHIPNWKKKDAEGKLNINEVQKVFLGISSHHRDPGYWLNEQLLSVTGVDVFTEAFPRDTGYKIYNFDSNMPVLVIRLEDLDRIGGLALQEFLSLANIELVNISDEKEYANLYRLFKQTPLPESYLQKTYNTKYARTFYTETEIASFLIKWQKNENFGSTTHQHHIIIYQMGKVGSKTIEQSLIQYYQSREIDVNIYHTHFLNHLEQLEKDAIENGVSHHGIQKIREAQELRRKLQDSPLRPWMVISLVRDPVARNIASFFQSLSVNEIVPNWKERYRRGKLDTKELQDVFLGLGDEYHQYPANWFDSQLKPVFGIDVFGDAFPYQTGYKIYESAMYSRLLVIRVENINSCIEQAMSEYLGLTEFKILNSNLGAEKDYADLYSKFKSLPLPLQYLDKVYNTRYARHFYSKEEIDSFIQKWANVKSIPTTFIDV